MRGRFWILALLVLLLSSCNDRVSVTPEAEAGPVGAEAMAALTEAEPDAGLSPLAELPPDVQRTFQLPQHLFALIPEKAQGGEPVTVGFSSNFGSRQFPNLRAVLLDSRGRRLGRAFFFDLPQDEGEPELKAAILAVPSTALVGEALIRIESDYEIIRDLPFNIEPRSFLSETIALNQANTNLRTLPDPQRSAESDQIWTILNTTGRSIYTWEPFLPPLSATRRTSYYGSRRIFQYAGGGTDTSIHAGVDYGVPTGTEVFASATGLVILARYRILTGYSVVLEHLPGVYSIYYHLNELFVDEGDFVTRGRLIAHSGATGLATGPHLHWEIRVAGENADPDAFLARPLLDKNAIIHTLDRY